MRLRYSLNLKFRGHILFVFILFPTIKLISFESTLHLIYISQYIDRHLIVMSPGDGDASLQPGLAVIPLYAEDLLLGGSLQHVGVELVHIRAVHIVEEAETVLPRGDWEGQQAGRVVELTVGRLHVYVVAFV